MTDRLVTMHYCEFCHAIVEGVGDFPGDSNPEPHFCRGVEVRCKGMGLITPDNRICAIYDVRAPDGKLVASTYGATGARLAMQIAEIVYRPTCAVCGQPIKPTDDWMTVSWSEDKTHIRCGGAGS